MNLQPVQHNIVNHWGHHQPNYNRADLAQTLCTALQPFIMSLKTYKKIVCNDQMIPFRAPDFEHVQYQGPLVDGGRVRGRLYWWVL
ncbi:hypothetical protein GDO81_019299 [Engystomops pustulosus]|uniref:Uncharacterized protein n=1 Tax=Engystomops pustulosus TaxID=76066 RepID=A0AAV6YGM5_ENGPU|nr:hypothetical protein GDO81_019299 [Engystomops pustulosus]